MDDPHIVMEMTAMKEELKEEPDDAVENDEKVCLWHVSSQLEDTSAVVNEENDSEEEEVEPPLTVFLSPEQHLEECLQEKDPLALDALGKDIPVDNKSPKREGTESHIEEEKFNETELDKSHSANEAVSPAEKILGVDCGFGPEVQLEEMESGATENEAAFACKICNRRLAAKSSLIRHIHTHKGEKTYESADVRLWLEFLKERTPVPKDETRFSCPVCGSECVGRRGLNVHMRTHTVEKPYECSFCGMGFTKESSLNTHTRSHTGERAYKCNICDKEFKQSSHLTEHIRIIHTGERPYTCSTCGKRFSRQQNLVTHGRSHSGDRPFDCSICGKRYPRKSGLLAHSRTHSGERPHQCPYCGKCFKEQSHLNNHWRVHTEERPFKCNICQRGFKQSYHLTKHVRVYTGRGHKRVASAESCSHVNAI